MSWRRSKSDGLHITKVGLWFLIFLLVIAAGATNTGNNGLFLVLAVMGGAVIASDAAGRLNLRGLRIGLTAPAEIFANNPSHLSVGVTNRSRWLPRWLLVLTVEPGDVVAVNTAARTSPWRNAKPAGGDPPHRRAKPYLAAFLPRSSDSQGRIEVLMRRRGRWRIRYAHVTSLFPLGFFRRGRRYKTDTEILVYPETYSPSSSRPAQLGRAGDEPTRRRGWGHDLLGLRAFRHGDDPRSIHWKQTARTGDMVFKERETEENRRFLIVFDNAVGELQTSARHRQFERLVSEAATAALDHLDGGYEVSLLTRDADLPFASGQQQRHRVLETLALIEPRARNPKVLASEVNEEPHLRLSMEAQAQPGFEAGAAPPSARQRERGAA